MVELVVVVVVAEMVVAEMVVEVVEAAVEVVEAVVVDNIDCVRQEMMSICKTADLHHISLMRCNHPLHFSS